MGNAAGEGDGVASAITSPTAGLVKPGDVVGGKYVIERLLGEGGMGAVYVAHQEQLGRRVAIKLLHPAALNHRDALVRFEREARAAAALQSDHIARVLDVGQLASGAPYLVMELLDGEDLAATLKRRGPLPSDEVVDAVTQACDALAEAHGIGIIHRDLKPANLFLVRRASGKATVKVLDFGISKAISGGGPAMPLTRTSALIGSPLYMSPEQLREARTVDARSDVWSLGVTMYELLTGRLPFEADTFVDLCGLVLNHDPRTVRQLRPELPVAIESVVTKCLRRDPTERFASVSELVAALQAVPRSFVVAAPSDPRLMSVPAALAVTDSAVASTHGGSLPGLEPKRGRGLVIGSVLTVACLGVCGFVLVHSASPARGTDAIAAASPPSATPAPTPRETASSTPQATSGPSPVPAPVASASPAASASGAPSPPPSPTIAPTSRHASTPPSPHRPPPSAKPAPTSADPLHLDLQ